LRVTSAVPSYGAATFADRLHRKSTVATLLWLGIRGTFDTLPLFLFYFSNYLQSLTLGYSVLVADNCRISYVVWYNVGHVC